MTSVAMIAREFDSDRDQYSQVSLLLDEEWVDAEFASIMIISGFGDRIVAAVLTPLMPRSVRRRSERDRIFRVATSAPRMRSQARTRSPP
jgi:hypothetical protein